jgi:hypothetical protein
MLPVGINVSFTGVNEFALMYNKCSLIVLCPAPSKLKKE